MLLVSLVAAVPANAAAVPPFPPCADASVSPAFAADGDMACIGRSGGGSFGLYLSLDRGLSWPKRAATGVTGASSWPGTVVFSPDYASDHAVYWATSAGLFRSVDDGETFTNVDNLTAYGIGQRRPSLFSSPLVPALGALSPRAVGVLAPGRTSPVSWLHQISGERPVSGAPAPTVDFAVTPAGTGLAVGFDWVSATDQARGKQLSLWGCDASWNCSRSLARFAAPGRNGQEFLAGAWLSPAFTSDRTAVFLTTSVKARVGAWRSTDGGATVTRWASLQRVLDGLAGFRQAPQMSLTISGDGRSMWFRARIASVVEQIWASHDGGRTWTLRASGRIGSNGKVLGRTNLPWDPASFLASNPDIRLAGRNLLAAAMKGERYTLWCSSDDGRAWRSRC